MKSAMSPRELARAIGVSVSSLKRWADEGKISFTRTIGGHRRISLAEAARFVRDQGIAIVEPEALGISGFTPATENAAEPQAEEVEELLDYLTRGDSRAVQGFMLGWYLAGRSVETLIDGPVRGVMQRLGERWHTESDGVFVEHRATDVAIQGLNQLRSLVEAQVDENAVVAVGGAPSGDPYVLATLAVSTVLMSYGLRAENLGASTPMSALLRACDHYQAQLVWMSVTATHDLGKLRTELEMLVSRVRDRDVHVVIGGQLAPRLVDSGLDGVEVVSSMAELGKLVTRRKLSRKRTDGGRSMPRNS